MHIEPHALDNADYSEFPPESVFNRHATNRVAVIRRKTKWRLYLYEALGPWPPEGECFSGYRFIIPDDTPKDYDSHENKVYLGKEDRIEIYSFGFCMEPIFADNGDRLPSPNIKVWKKTERYDGDGDTYCFVFMNDLFDEEKQVQIADQGIGKLSHLDLAGRGGLLSQRSVYAIIEGAENYLEQHASYWLNSSKKDRYRFYLQSKYWGEKRMKVMERDGGLCRICNENKANDVHHLTYERIFQEAEHDLISVCRSCHEQLHLNKTL